MNTEKNKIIENHSQETTENSVNRGSHTGRTASGRPDTNKSQTKSKKSSLRPIDNSIYDGVASNEGMNKPVTSLWGKEIIEKVLRYSSLMHITSEEIKEQIQIKNYDGKEKWINILYLQQIIKKALTLAEKDFNKKVEELKKEIEKRRIPMKLGNIDQNTSRINAHLYEIIELINKIFSKLVEEKNEKPKAVIINDNPVSLMGYAEEYLENFKKICDALDKNVKEKK